MPDFIKTEQTPPIPTVPPVQPSYQRKRRLSFLAKSVIVLVIVIVLLVGGIAAKVVMSINSTNQQSGERVSFFQQIAHLVVNPEKSLTGETDDRINILLLGIGGAGHEGPLLTDTIIVLSIKPSTADVAMISLPRDLLVEFPKYGFRKINNMLAFAQDIDYQGELEVYASEIVGSVIGVPIHYFARIDFKGFEKIIDDLGGVDIYVDQAFTDYQYPDENYGFEPVTFQQGWEHMNGARALKYVRSRHGTNGEGSDFARSRRQQKVLIAVKQKLLGVNALLAPTTIVNALNDLGSHSKTNLEVWQMLKLGKFAPKIQDGAFITRVFDASPESPLKAITTDQGAYALVPKDGSFGEVRFITRNIFTLGAIARENARIKIQNGTTVAGLGQTIASELSGLGYTISSVANAQAKDYTKTIVYDLSGGTKPLTLATLQAKLNAKVVSALPTLVSPSDQLNYEDIRAKDIAQIQATSSGSFDFVVIVGSDQASSSNSAATSRTILKQNS